MRCTNVRKAQCAPSPPFGALHKSWSFISDDPHFAMENPALLQRRISACLMEVERTLGTRQERIDLAKMTQCMVRP